MTTLKVLLAVLFTSLLFSFPKSSHSEILSGGKVSEVNHQLVQEVKDMLTIPLLKYRDGDLTGIVKVFAKIEKNGKITVVQVIGENRNLVSNVKAKMKSLNAWANPENAGTVFLYYVNFVEA